MASWGRPEKGTVQTSASIGLMGHTPDVDAIPGLIKKARTVETIALLAMQRIAFREKDHLLMYRREAMAEHLNGMQFSGWGQ